MKDHYPQTLQPFIASALTAGEQIHRLLQDELAYYTEGENATGDQQLSVDLKANEALREVFQSIPEVATYISEEEEQIIPCNPQGTYSVATDPLDGSSVAPAGVASGTSIGIYSTPQPHSGQDLWASIYILYGSALYCAIFFQEKTKLWRKNSQGEWNEVPLQDLSGEAAIFGPGAFRSMRTMPEYEEVFHHLSEQGYKVRFMGSFTVDMQHMITRGKSVFMYPEMKLRLLYELIPMAAIVESLGGKAVNNQGVPILKLPVETIHSTASIIIGAAKTVAKLKTIMEKQSE